MNIIVNDQLHSCYRDPIIELNDFAPIYGKDTRCRGKNEEYKTSSILPVRSRHCV